MLSSCLAHIIAKKSLTNIPLSESHARSKTSGQCTENPGVLTIYPEKPEMEKQMVRVIPNETFQKTLLSTD
jgi:hypothetical protein